MLLGHNFDLRYPRAYERGGDDSDIISLPDQLASLRRAGQAPLDASSSKGPSHIPGETAHLSGFSNAFT